MRLRSAAILRGHMTHKHYSQGRLATYSGCSKQFINYLCNGSKTSCTPQLANRIAVALDVPLDQLFEPHVSTVTGRNDKQRRTPPRPRAKNTAA